MLILPSEASHPGLSRRFEDRRHDDFAMDPAFALVGLAGSDGDQRLIVDRLDEAVAEGIEHCAQGSDIFGGRDVLLGLRADGAIVHDGAARDGVLSIVDEDGGVDEVSVLIVVTDA